MANLVQLDTEGSFSVELVPIGAGHGNHVGRSGFVVIALGRTIFAAQIGLAGANAGRNGGEYYTPRLLIRTMIKVVKPTLNDTVYDGAAAGAHYLHHRYDDERKGALEVWSKHVIGVVERK